MLVILLSLIAVLSNKRTLDLIMNQVRVQINLNLAMSVDMACKLRPHHVELQVRLVVWTLCSSVFLSIVWMLTMACEFNSNAYSWKKTFILRHFETDLWNEKILQFQRILNVIFCLISRVKIVISIMIVKAIAHVIAYTIS